MRRCIRGAIKEGFDRIAVVCGAWHAPVLTADALKENPAKADDEVLKGLAGRADIPAANSASEPESAAANPGPPLDGLRMGGGRTSSAAS